jgi:RND family efflux transporter MFP subunit
MRRTAGDETVAKQSTDPFNPSLSDDLAALKISRTKRPDKGNRLAGRVLRGIVVALVLGGVATAGWFVANRPVAVAIVSAERSTRGALGPLPVLAGSGYIVTGERYVSIGTRIAGRIDRFFVEEGDHVRAGDTLVQFDDRDYQAAVTRTEAGLQVARANAALAEAEYRRSAALRSKSVVSEQEVDVLRTRAEVARATVAQIAAELDQARINLDYTVLRSPTDGVVLAKLKEVGEIAVPGGFEGSGDLVRIANLQDLRAELDVNESDLSRVRPEQPAEVVPDAHPNRRYAARVVKLYPQVDRQKGTLKVEVRVLEPDALLLPDMSVRVSFLEPVDPARADDPVVLVPAAAVQRDNSGSFVWRIDGDSVTRVAVESLGNSAERVIIGSGLAGSETIVAEAVELAAGSRVVAKAAPAP